jgi:hypothetical protein
MKTFKLTSDLYELLVEQMRLLFEFYELYTKKDYVLDKIDLVILPLASISQFSTNDLKTTNMGVVYLPEAYLTEYGHDVYAKINTIQLKLKYKITNILAKQLSKHWFSKSNDYHCDTNEPNENEAFIEKIANIKLICSSMNCTTGNRTLLSKSVFADLQIYQKCFLYKALVNWMGYLAFQSIYPELFDLVLSTILFSNL